MYEIVLCDDMVLELEQIENLIAEYARKKPALCYQIEKFESAQEMLDQIREEKRMPDLLLMDIFMEGKTGIEAVRELREDGYRMPVVFLTTSTEHALNAYEVDAIQYLVKPLLKEQFFHAMDMAFQMIQKEREEPFVLRVSGSVRQIYPDQIVYCEAQRNYQILFLEEEEVRVRMTGGELFQMLEHFPWFLRCGSSYILNLNHIVAVDKEEIRLDDGRKIFVSKSRAAEIKKKYFDFYFRKR